MAKKTMVIVSQEFYPNHGSFSGFVEELARYAQKKDYHIKILCGEYRGKKLKESLSYAEVHRFKLKSYKFLGNVINAIMLGKKVRQHIKKHKNALIIANGESAFGLRGLKFVLRSPDQPAKIILKNLEIAKNEVSIKTRLARLVHLNLLYLLEKMYVNRASGIIFSSFETKGLFDKYYTLGKKPYFIPISGVDRSRFKSDAKKKNSDVKILFISKQGERIRKGIMYLEQELPKLFDKYDNLKLIHVGDKFKWDIDSKYNDKIISVGRVPWDKLNKYYKTADMLVNCSLQEGFPNVILEGMAAGCPILTSNFEGITEYITHLKSGYIFERGNPKELEKGISFLIDNPGKAKTFAINALNKIKNLDNKYYFGKLIKFIEKSHQNKAISVNLLKQ